MRPIAAALFCLLACHATLGPALAAEEDSAAILLKERLDVRAKSDKLSQEDYKATAGLQTRRT